VKVNRILLDAVREFNLSTTSIKAHAARIPGDEVGVWDGKSILFSQQGNYWDLIRLAYKYGLAPFRANWLKDKIVNKFLKMYDEPMFPWDSLDQVIRDIELIGVTGSTGEQFTAENGISESFTREILQAATRVNYAQNLKYIHGMEAMVSMAADGAIAVDGGNWQIFDHMVNASQATKVMETSVSSIQRTGNLYRLAFYETEDASGLSLKVQDFDAVVLAAPHQFSKLTFNNHPVNGIPDQVPYVQLHVTLFTSLHLISPSFVNQAPGNPAPKVILTTLPPGEEAKEGADGCGSPGFFSVSLLRPVTNPKTGAPEYLYKIFSPSPVNETFFAHLLGLRQPHDYTTASQVSYDKDISWIYRKVWNSYPYEYPRVTFEPIQLDPGLWYTAGMDSFISTMETNALMGKNVAKLMVDKWVKEYGFEGARQGSREISELLSMTEIEDF
jgi:prenylcysteine oxidase / farnesylcysteine lyase